MLIKLHYHTINQLFLNLSIIIKYPNSFSHKIRDRLIYDLINDLFDYPEHLNVDCIFGPYNESGSKDQCFVSNFEAAVSKEKRTFGTIYNNVAYIQISVLIKSEGYSKAICLYSRLKTIVQFTII